MSRSRCDLDIIYRTGVLSLLQQQQLLLLLLLLRLSAAAAALTIIPTTPRCARPQPKIPVHGRLVVRLGFFRLKTLPGVFSVGTSLSAVAAVKGYQCRQGIRVSSRDKSVVKSAVSGQEYRQQCRQGTRAPSIMPSRDKSAVNNAVKGQECRQECRKGATVPSRVPSRENNGIKSAVTGKECRQENRQPTNILAPEVPHLSISSLHFCSPQ